MAISTFTELQSAIANTLHRSDLSALLVDFIALGETRIFHGSQDRVYPSSPLRVRNMQNRDSSTVGALGAIAFPTQYIETIRLMLTINGDNRVLEYRSPVDFATFETQTGTAFYYTVVNNSIYVGPYDGSAYTHDYYKTFDPLATTSTNWLLTNAPGVYLYAALIETAPYINKDSRLDTWYRMYSAAINAVQDTDKNAAKGRSGLAVVLG